MSILDDWQITAEELTIAVNSNPSLRGMLFGYIAEFHLKKFFAGHDLITAMRKDDDHDRRRKGDLVITYNEVEFKVESKSLQTNSVRELTDDRFVGKVQCDASDRRRIILPHGESIETTCLLRGEFDLLAVCLFAFKKEWTFIFALNADLPGSRYAKYSMLVREHILASLIQVTWPPSPPFVVDPFPLLDRLIEEKAHF